MEDSARTEPTERRPRLPWALCGLAVALGVVRMGIMVVVTSQPAAGTAVAGALPAGTGAA